MECNGRARCLGKYILGQESDHMFVHRYIRKTLNTKASTRSFPSCIRYSLNIRYTNAVRGRQVSECENIAADAI
jgi:hypothetical protein